MMRYNEALFRKHGLTTLVTSCPICLKVFKEDYSLAGIEVLHHSEYIQRLISQGRLDLRRGEETMTYHDPCELGRGGGIYDEPRSVISELGTLVEPSQRRENALCCGSSLANTEMNNTGQMHIARALGRTLSQTGASMVVTACPLCKKAIARGTKQPVLDLAEVVEMHLKSK
jgi:Fe-S oxidoreductase